jgi:hypothetical protein
MTVDHSKLSPAEARHTPVGVFCDGDLISNKVNQSNLIARS